MKISLNWLQDFVQLKKNLTPKEMAWRLTEATSEVERIHCRGEGLDSVVVGEITHIKKHPDAEKLYVAKVKVSSKKTIQVIFGDKAPISVGNKVPTAVAPVTLPEGEVKKMSIRGVPSEGMLCLDSELLPDLPATLTYFPKKTPIGKKVTELLPLKDVVFEIDNHSITHRADLFSHYGFCRELVALGLAKWRKQYPNYHPQKMAGKKKMPFKVTFENNEMTSSYHGTIVEGLDNRQSPNYMKYRLAACGIRAINAIVDITNYVMLEAGTPLHAFERRAITGKTFDFRFAKDGETMTTLDGKEQKLIKGVMIGETDGKIIDLLGIMGGENSEVIPDTTSVYFHMDLCNPVFIRKAMIGLGHRTDAGTMYEKGLNPELSALGISRCLELTKQIFKGAKCDYEMIAKHHVTPRNQQVEITSKKLNKHLGIEIPLVKAKKILEDLGCKVSTTATKLKATIPCWRKNSLQIEEDLAEEIARINGYSNIPTVLPQMGMGSGVRNSRKLLIRRVKQSMIAQGFLEELNYSFMSAQLLQSAEIQVSKSLAEIKNPVSDDFRYMRPSLLPYLLKNAGRNSLSKNKAWKTFELGTVFHRDSDEIREALILMAVITGQMQDTEMLRHMKGTLKNLLDQLRVDFLLVEESHTFAYPGRSLAIIANGENIGAVYELHPILRQQFDLKANAVILELNVDHLALVEKRKITYQPISRYPEVQLDMSMIVDEQVKCREIETIIRSAEPTLLRSLELTDIFKGKQIEKNKKSLTYSMVYQSSEKTLEDAEIKNILRTLISSLEESGATIRK